MRKCYNSNITGDICLIFAEICHCDHLQHIYQLKAHSTYHYAYYLGIKHTA